MKKPAAAPVAELLANKNHPEWPAVIERYKELERQEAALTPQAVADAAQLELTERAINMIEEVLR